jgi:hypothetical protein
MKVKDVHDVPLQYFQAVSGSGSWSSGFRSLLRVNFRRPVHVDTSSLALSVKSLTPVLWATHANPGLEQTDNHEPGPATYGQSLQNYHPQNM